jgi:hypothetical protein
MGQANTKKGGVARVVESEANNAYKEEDQVEQQSDDYNDEDQEAFERVASNERGFQAAPHKDLSSSPAK